MLDAHEPFPYHSGHATHVFTRSLFFTDKPPFPHRPMLEISVWARTAVVAVLVAVAVAEVRRLDKIVALVGGFLGIPLAFVYPLAVHLRLVPNAPARTRALSVVAMAVGAVLGLACSAVTVMTWNRS